MRRFESEFLVLVAHFVHCIGEKSHPTISRSVDVVTQNCVLEKVNYIYFNMNMFHQAQVCYCRYCNWNCWYIKVWSRCVNYRLRINQIDLGLNPAFTRFLVAATIAISAGMNATVYTVKAGKPYQCKQHKQWKRWKYNVSSASSVSHCGYHRHFVTKNWAALCAGGSTDLIL